MKEQLEQQLINIGYHKINSNLREFTAYFEMGSSYVNVILLVEDNPKLVITAKHLAASKESVKKTFESKGFADVHVLVLFMGNDMIKAKAVGMEDNFCWIIHSELKKLVILENHTPDFYGLKNKLENWLISDTNKNEYANQRYHEKEKYRNNAEKRGFQNILLQMKWKRLAYVNIAIVLINVLVFLICTFTGDLLYNSGVQNYQLVVTQGEYYRLITAMFLHAGIDHIVSNMLLLFFMGEVAENVMGHFSYFILYFLSGICGGILSVMNQYREGAYVNSLGASGAVFGVIGAILFHVVINRGRLAQISLGRLMFMIVYALYQGFLAKNIDNAAHIGGLISGFIIACVIYGSKLLFMKGKGKGSYEY